MRNRVTNLPQSSFFDIHFGRSGDVLHFYLRNQDEAETFVECLNSLGKYQSTTGKMYDYIISEQGKKIQSALIHGTLRYRVKMHKEAYRLAVQNPSISETYFKDALSYDAMSAFSIACSNIITQQIKPLLDTMKSGDSTIADNISKILAISDQEISPEKKIRTIIEEMKQGTEGVGGFLLSSFRGQSTKLFLIELEKLNLVGQWHDKRKEAQQKYPLTGVGVLSNPVLTQSTPVQTNVSHAGIFFHSTASSTTNAFATNPFVSPPPVIPNFMIGSSSQVLQPEESSQNLFEDEYSSDHQIVFSRIFVAEEKIKALAGKYKEAEDIASEKWSVSEDAIINAKKSLVEIKGEIEKFLKQMNADRVSVSMLPIEINSILPEIKTQMEVQTQPQEKSEQAQLNERRKMLEAEINKLKQSCSSYTSILEGEISGNYEEAQSMASDAEKTISKKQEELKKIEAQLMTLSISNIQNFHFQARPVNSSFNPQENPNHYTSSKRF